MCVARSVGRGNGHSGRMVVLFRSFTPRVLVCGVIVRWIREKRRDKAIVGLSVDHNEQYAEIFGCSPLYYSQQKLDTTNANPHTTSQPPNKRPKQRCRRRPAQPGLVRLSPAASPPLHRQKQKDAKRHVAKKERYKFGEHNLGTR